MRSRCGASDRDIICGFRWRNRCATMQVSARVSFCCTCRGRCQTKTSNPPSTNALVFTIRRGFRVSNAMPSWHACCRVFHCAKEVSARGVGAGGMYSTLFRVHRDAKYGDALVVHYQILHRVQKVQKCRSRKKSAAGQKRGHKSGTFRGGGRQRRKKKRYGQPRKREYVPA